MLSSTFVSIFERLKNSEVFFFKQCENIMIIIMKVS